MGNDASTQPTSMYTDEEQIKTILDFLYLIAKTMAKSEMQVKVPLPEGDIEHKNVDFIDF